MSPKLALALLLALSAGWASGQTRIFRCGLEYTNSPEEARLRGCVSVDGGAIDQPPPTRKSSCPLGTRCIVSQGTQIPAKTAIEIGDRCEEFTFNDLGRAALRMSKKEVLDSAGGAVTPLLRAWYAFDGLYDSPLKFTRRKNAEDTSYAEIKGACLQLHRDFMDERKWTR